MKWQTLKPAVYADPTIRIPLGFDYGRDVSDWTAGGSKQRKHGED
jgi:hypothetical protein